MNQQTKWSQFGVLIIVFFFWGFVAASNSIFIPFCKTFFNLDQIQSRWQTLLKVAESSGDRKQSITQMLDYLGERYIMAPAAMSSYQPGSYPGGLLETTLSVIKKMRSISKALDLDVPTESIVIVGICHSLGLLGGPDPGEDYLVRQDSDWHVRQGKLYFFFFVWPEVNFERKFGYFFG